MAERAENFPTMRIHCKVVALAVCLGVFLLLYFFGGNAADERPPLRQVEEDHKLPTFPSAPGLGKLVSVKVVKPPEPPRQIRPNRKEGSRGGNASAKLR